MPSIMNKDLEYTDFEANSKLHHLVERVLEKVSKKASEKIWLIRGGYHIRNKFFTAAHGADRLLEKVEPVSEAIKNPILYKEAGGYDIVWHHREIAIEHLMTHFDELESYYSGMPVTSKTTKLIKVLRERLLDVYGTHDPRGKEAVKLRKQELKTAEAEQNRKRGYARAPKARDQRRR